MDGAVHPVDALDLENHVIVADIGETAQHILDGLRSQIRRPNTNRPTVATAQSNTGHDPVVPGHPARPQPPHPRRPRDDDCPIRAPQSALIWEWITWRARHRGPGHLSTVDCRSESAEVAAI